ncbi:MAG: hypothetical protein IJ561_06555 [Ruminococcus sp.]|nr:hypothetical protein [Ruminococcus sp.]
MREKALHLRSETTNGRQNIRYETELNGITYHITMTLNADGEGTEDAKKKLLSLLENELRRQLKNN